MEVGTLLQKPSALLNTATRQNKWRATCYCYRHKNVARCTLLQLAQKSNGSYNFALLATATFRNLVYSKFIKYNNVTSFAKHSKIWFVCFLPSIRLRMGASRILEENKKIILDISPLIKMLLAYIFKNSRDMNTFLSFFSKNVNA